MRKLLLYIIAFCLLPCLAAGVGALTDNAGRLSLSSSLEDSVPEGTLPETIPFDTSVAHLHGDTLPSAILDSMGIRLADTIASIDSVAIDDSTRLFDSIMASDSLVLDSIAHSDSIPLPKAQVALPDTFVARVKPVTTKVDLDYPVDFQSSDSMIIIRRDSAYMYGKSSVKYGQIKLDAANIDLDLNTTTVYAVGAVDSLGEMTGKPVFTEGGANYEANTMRYNFGTEKGYITDVVTQQGEGYLTGGKTKKDEEGNYYIENGRYTTCDDTECPHFYFNLTKAKMRPGKDVVVGPVYMVLAGLPLPLALPFGYFPFNEEYSSGVIFPSFGDDYQRGFYLRDGGYYFAINDNVDLALTGEIYTKGSWGINAQSSYAKRYKFSGNFSMNYLKTIYGEKGSPDYSSQTNFQVLWSHTQDSKANPNMNLSASVNFTTSGYSRNDLNSYYSSAFTENTKSSTVNMTYRIPNSKWSFSTTLNVSQRSQDSTLSVSFPNITLTMSQVYPFKRKKKVGAEKWYEKIRLSYSGQFQNSLTSKQNEFFKKNLIKDWRNGMRHSVPISATFNLLKYFNVTPSVNLTDRMYTTKVRRQWDPNASAEVADTLYSLYNVFDFSASVSIDTKLYGFWRPIGFLKKKISMIRHVITPSVSFSGAPDFGAKFFGYYGEYQYPDAQGNMQTRRYSLFPNSLFGVPGEGKSGTLSYQISNNLELKTRSDNDSIEPKKISLIENLSLSQSYNFAADSLNWSNLNTSILLRLTKGFNLNLSATWDVYTYQLNANGQPVRVNIPRWKAGKGIGRLSSTGTSFSYTFNNDTFKRKDKKDKNNNNNKGNSDSDMPGDSHKHTHANRESDKKDGDGDEGGYEKWEVPWSLSVNYSIGYAYGSFNYEKLEYNPRITQNLSFSGSIRPTKNWNFSFTASYNFETHKLAYMNCNISRDLHCFAMRASFVPVGPYKNYTFNIAVKSAMLSDLKYDKRSSVANGVTWY